MLILNSHFIFKPALENLFQLCHKQTWGKESSHIWALLTTQSGLKHDTMSRLQNSLCPMCHTLMKYNISTPCLSDSFPIKSVLVVAINTEKEQDTVHSGIIFPTCLPKEWSWCASSACLCTSHHNFQALSKFWTKRIYQNKFPVRCMSPVRKRIVAWTQILLDILKSSYRACMKVPNMGNASLQSMLINSNVRQKPSSISNAAPWNTNAYLSVKIFLQSLQHHSWY